MIMKVQAKQSLPEDIQQPWNTPALQSHTNTHITDEIPMNNRYTREIGKLHHKVNRFRHLWWIGLQTLQVPALAPGFASTFWENIMPLWCFKWCAMHLSLYSLKILNSKWTGNWISNWRVHRSSTWSEKTIEDPGAPGAPSIRSCGKPMGKPPLPRKPWGSPPSQLLQGWASCSQPRNSSRMSQIVTASRYFK